MFNNDLYENDFLMSLDEWCEETSQDTVCQCPGDEDDCICYIIEEFGIDAVQDAQKTRLEAQEAHERARELRDWGFSTAKYCTITDFINKLVEQYKYKALPKWKSKAVKDFYAKNIPSELLFNFPMHMPIETLGGDCIAEGAERIVVGDYGAYLEIHMNNMIEDEIHIPQKQLFRTKPDFKGKYIWFESKDGTKIYYQLRGVPYADYLPNYYYISVYDVKQFMINSEDKSGERHSKGGCLI